MSMTAEQAEAVGQIRARFDELQVGQEAELDRAFDEAEVRRYAASHQIPYPGSYVGADGELLVVPALIFMRPAMTFGIRDGAPLARLGIYTRARRRYARPVRVGERLHFKGQIVEKYVRRGYYIIVVDWTARDVGGDEVAGGREWHTLGFVRDEGAA